MGPGRRRLLGRVDPRRDTSRRPVHPDAANEPFAPDPLRPVRPVPPAAGRLRAPEPRSGASAAPQPRRAVGRARLLRHLPVARRVDREADRVAPPAALPHPSSVSLRHRHRHHSGRLRGDVRGRGAPLPQPQGPSPACPTRRGSSHARPPCGRASHRRRRPHHRLASRHRWPRATDAGRTHSLNLVESNVAELKTEPEAEETLGTVIPLASRPEARPIAASAPVTALASLARDAGLGAVNIVGWRDLDDAEAGGSELHAATIARLWAAAGIAVTMRPSSAWGHPAP